jgi:hypothetical protein
MGLSSNTRPLMTGASLSADRREAFEREELRDLGGIAIGVAAGAFVWLAFLSLMRLHV